MSDDALTPEQTQRVVAIALDLAREGRRDELLEFIEHGLPIETADASGNTLLMLAAYHGFSETLHALIEAGADVNALNARGQSPIAGAIFKGEDDVVRMLVRAGADLDAGTPTARDAAVMFGRDDLLA